MLMALGRAPARADTLVAEAPPPPAPEPVRRPRFSLAIGMGVTLDRSGFMPERTVKVPSFVAVAGVGDGLLGADFGVFASAASGRYRTTDTPVDRLALDAAAVARPGARWRPGDKRVSARTLRSLAVELGLGFERDGQSAGSGSRFGLHTGAHIEVPLTQASYGDIASPDGRGPAPRERSALGVRLGVRHLFGLYTPQAAAIVVGDSTELYAALGLSF
jgi:hypothetical protein